MQQHSRDWFRKTTWTAEDQADFRARLEQSRKKSQSLRIQGVALADQGGALAEAAIALFDEVTNQYPDSPDVAFCLHQKARCLETLGNIPAALEGYRAAIAHKQPPPHVHTGAWLDFAWLVARERLAEHYEEALALLKTPETPLIFPVERFRWHACLAIILAARGDAEAAAQEARKALSEAQSVQTGLRDHAVGLVGDKHAAERDALAKIAKGPHWLGRMFGFS